MSEERRPRCPRCGQARAGQDDARGISVRGSENGQSLMARIVAVERKHVGRFRPGACVTRPGRSGLYPYVRLGTEFAWSTWLVIRHTSAGANPNQPTRGGGVGDRTRTSSRWRMPLRSRAGSGRRQPGPWRRRGTPPSGTPTLPGRSSSSGELNSSRTGGMSQPQHSGGRTSREVILDRDLSRGRPCCWRRRRSKGCRNRPRGPVRRQRRSASPL